MIVGLGVDLVAVRRFERLLERYGERASAKLFSTAERADCDGRANRGERFAARFAAKEALLKALAVPPGLRWQEIEVQTAANGAPRLVLSGEAARAAARQGVTSSHLSLTHADGMAVAVVVLEGTPGGR